MRVDRAEMAIRRAGFSRLGRAGEPDLVDTIPADPTERGEASAVWIALQSLSSATSQWTVCRSVSQESGFNGWVHVNGGGAPCS